MNKLFGFLIALSAAASLLLNACHPKDSNDSSECFRSKEDSIAFAKLVMAKYTVGDNTTSVGFNQRTAADKASFTGARKFNPVDWTNIDRWAQFYNDNPILRDSTGAPITGFMIDTNGMNLLKANNNYKKVYLRFGKYSRDSSNKHDYTVMIVPLNDQGGVLHRGPASGVAGRNSNYDELDPCPSQCPTDWTKK